MALLARNACLSKLFLRQLNPCITGRVSAAGTWREDQQKFWQKNEKSNRPLSPHLTIYRLPLPAWMSVTHRATGCAMVAGVAGFSIGMSILPSDFATYLALVKSWSYGPGLIFLAKLYLVWPFAYHSMNGIRHLMWDTGRGLQMKALYSSSYAVIGLSVAIATAVAAM